MVSSFCVSAFSRCVLRQHGLWEVSWCSDDQRARRVNVMSQLHACLLDIGCFALKLGRQVMRLGNSCPDHLWELSDYADKVITEMEDAHSFGLIKCIYKHQGEAFMTSLGALRPGDGILPTFTWHLTSLQMTWIPWTKSVLFFLSYPMRWLLHSS